MPKAVSPVRLQQELMQRATLTGARHQRSAAEQIEYWAALGQQVAGILDPDKLLDVIARNPSPSTMGFHIIPPVFQTGILIGNKCLTEMYDPNHK